MPTYTYNCPQCGATFDRRASITARDDQRCDPYSKNCKGKHIALGFESKLNREEIPEGGTMPTNWSEWQR